MKISSFYSHQNAIDILKAKETIYNEIERILNNNVSFNNIRPNEIKKLLNDEFNNYGWADRVNVGTSNLTINYVKNKVGVCLQLGNVARTYADILKLMFLYSKSLIDVGIIIVPEKYYANRFGANYAQFERLQNEVNQFSEIINIPLMIIGITK